MYSSSESIVGSMNLRTVCELIKTSRRVKVHRCRPVTLGDRIEYSSTVALTERSLELDELIKKVKHDLLISQVIVMQVSI